MGYALVFSKSRFASGFLIYGVFQNSSFCRLGQFAVRGVQSSGEPSHGPTRRQSHAKQASGFGGGCSVLSVCFDSVGPSVAVGHDWSSLWYRNGSYRRYRPGCHGHADSTKHERHADQDDRFFRALSISRCQPGHIYPEVLRERLPYLHIQSSTS